MSDYLNGTKHNDLCESVSKETPKQALIDLVEFRYGQYFAQAPEARKKFEDVMLRHFWSIPDSVNLSDLPITGTNLKAPEAFKHLADLYCSE